MTQALYRKYRSKSLSEVVGQAHVTDVLARSLSQGRIAHAYLLTGPRGVGKTSIARILAYEINKLPYDEQATHLDIIEIDAASNNGVEDVRDLREKVQIAPVSADKKIYIIDEVHMLSKAAFNALLKTLEEPPEHAVFILATTDVDKLPPTIISRTQRFSFRTIGIEDAVKHLRHIATEEKIKVADDALELIALRGDGSFRDSISLLDQLRSLSDDKEGITRALVEQSLGLAPLEHVEKLLEAYSNKDLKTIVELLDESDRSGIQPSVLTSQLIQKVRVTIAEKPQLLALLDQLLDVARSSQPSIKLLTVLGTHSVKPKSVALTAASPEVSAPLAELAKQATKPHPVAPSAQTAQIPHPQTNSQGSNASLDKIIASQQKPILSKNKQEVDTIKPGLENALDFDWDKLIEYARQNFVAVYSVLSKCGYEIDGSDFTLYTANAFYKKKLDDAKHHINLLKSFEEIGAGGFLITTIGTPPPPKDSTAAAVAAIMGGGEEVTVDA
ncbi:MAG: dnaX [Candidatus Saccharibacteria bacterium]|nr:dnaX [Candidatus Saccharibacteria bacterium]